MTTETLDREPDSPPSNAEATPLESLARVCQRLEERLAELKQPSNVRVPGLQDALKAIYECQKLTLQHVDSLHAKLDELAAAVAKPIEPALPPEPPTESAPSPASTEDWEDVLFGHDLLAGEKLADDRRRLVADLQAFDERAVGFVARLLLMRTAPPSEMPVLLKDLGEAFYRWRPRTTDAESPLEQALVSWLQKRIEAERLPNRIDLVRVGDRFDSARHASAQRGQVVTEVLGWAVLRDNGKPLSKANVVTK